MIQKTVKSMRQMCVCEGVLDDLEGRSVDNETKMVSKVEEMRTRREEKERMIGIYQQLQFASNKRKYL